MVTIFEYYAPSCLYVQIMAAQNFGISGVLIYTDPENDGAATIENGYTPFVCP